MNSADARVELDASLIQFLSQELGVPTSRLAPGTTLGRDLGVDGDDGLELIAAYGRRFDVDLSAFRPGKHFGPEAAGNPLIWLWWVVSRSWPKFVPITLADLELSRQARRWVVGSDHAV
jgi:hypothetical protein